MGNTDSKIDAKIETKLAENVDPVVGVQNGQPANVGWNRTFKRLRTAALYILVGAVALSIFISVFTPYKYFPKQPNVRDLQAQKLLREVKEYRSPLRRHDAGPQFI
jgi:hypothetical protein